MFPENTLIMSDGAPNLTHPSFQNFKKARDGLMLQERSQRSDHEFRTTLSPTAIKASSIITKIRSGELKSTWSTSVNPSMNSEELFPGMMFNIAKPALESTKLWKIIQKMPKGSLLHCHLGAMVDLNWVFTEALNMEGLCIYSDVPLINDTVREKASIRHLYSSSADLEHKPSIWSSDYIPGSLIPLTTAAESFPKCGRQGFIAWMKDRCSITQTESLQHHLGVDDVWRKLNAAFTILTGVIYYEPIMRKFLPKFFATLLEDNVRWVEIRFAPFTGFYPEKQSTPTSDPGVLLGVLNDEIEKFKGSEAGKGFWGARMIWASLRFWPTQKIIEDMSHCIRLKKIYPQLISGYDLVGHEDPGRTLENLTPELLWFQEECSRQNVNIPLFLHAGETVGCGTPTDQNLYTAILLRSRRLGHAFSLYKHPLLIDHCKQQNILVESCPISNEVLRYSASIMSHPLPALISRGVKAALSNDDPALLGQGTSGLSHDFWQAIQGWEDLGIEGLGSLAESSVRWSVFEDESEEEWKEGVEKGYKGGGIRVKRMLEWKREWEGFCEWVVEEFGDRF